MARSALEPSARPGWLAAACVLAAVYVFPLYLPPTDTGSVGDASYFARQFPGVPPSWIVGRLLALGLAAVAFACALRSPQVATPAVRPYRSNGVLRPGYLRLALALAGVLLAAALAADHLGPWMQTLFALLLPLPALCTHIAYRRHLRLAPNRSAVACGLLVVTWIVARAVAGWGDPRAATPVDAWLNFKSFSDALAQSDNLLTGRFEPGMPDFVHVLNGGSFLVLAGWPPTFVFLKGISFAWMAWTAAVLFGFVRRQAGGDAALVAVCALLFAPMTMLAPLTPMPLAFGMAMGGTLFALFHHFYSRHSPAALVGLATLGAFASTVGHTVIPAAFLGVATAVLLFRRRHEVPRLVVAIACVAVAAVLIPLFPDLDALGRMRTQYLDRFVSWPVVESVLLGQTAPTVLLEAAPTRRPLEIALTALAAPLVTARTPLRLWGDVFLEPIATVLALVAVIGLAMRRGRGEGKLVLAFMITAMLPGLTSSYDRPSLIRVICMPFLVAVFTGLGFATLTRRRRSTIAAAVGVAIGLSGWWLSDVTNRRIVAQSWVAIALEATATTPPEQVALLDIVHRLDTAFLNVAVMAEHIPLQPLARLGYDGIDSIARPNGQPAASVLLWSPALEGMAQVSQALCARWPQTRLFQLSDEARRSQAWAAAVDSHWQPGLAPQRWVELPKCSQSDPALR